MRNILLTGFRRTSSEFLVKKADYQTMILPNDKVLDSQLLLAELELQHYEYIFSFGQKPNIKDKVYVETAARNGKNSIPTDFDYNKLLAALKTEKIAVHISNNAGTSFCNELYWNVLSYIRSRQLKTKMLFLHIPFCKNITAVEAFFDQILRVIENY